MEERDIAYIVEAHMRYALSPKKKVRKWDNKTPYYIHPLWCATMMATEVLLDEKTRQECSLALGYHDVSEDTTASLPLWLPSSVLNLVRELQFTSSEDEWEHLWERSERARLCKLYDKTHNFLDGNWMMPDRRKQHFSHFARLREDVRRNYGGNIHIFKLADAIQG